MGLGGQWGRNWVSNAGAGWVQGRSDNGGFWAWGNLREGDAELGTHSLGRVIDAY